MSRALYSDPELQKLDIRLANVAYYHAHRQKLIKDITDVRIDVIIFKRKNPNCDLKFS